MKRVLMSGILGAFIFASAYAATAVKYTFTDVQFVDAAGNVVATGTVQAGVKTTKRNQTITCNYFTNPNDQYAGDFEATDNTINGDSASAVRSFCEQNFQNRQILPR